jgi:hypothetical protein
MDLLENVYLYAFLVFLNNLTAKYYKI